MNSSRIQTTDLDGPYASAEADKEYWTSNSEAESERHSLEPQDMIPAEYWTTRVQVVRKIERFTESKINISLIGYPKRTGRTEKEWAYTEDAQNYFVELNALRAQVTICDKQAEDLTCIPDEAGNRLRQPGLQFWAYCSENNIDQRFKKTIRWRKLKLRKKLIARSLTQKYKSDSKFQCPITKRWDYRFSMKAIHLFPYRSGQATMSTIFGPEADRELFSPNNGILVDRYVAPAIKQGFLLIVPDLHDEATNEEFARWHASEPKDYKIKIPDRECVQVGGYVEFNHRLLDLDGTKVEFHGDARPKSHYLYYFYMQSLLRQAWRFTEQYLPSDALVVELCRPHWGIPSCCTDTDTAWAISMAEAMGPRYQVLADRLGDSSNQDWVNVSAADDSNTPAKRDLSALAVASEHIAYETVGQDFDDCESGPELDDSDNDSVPELVAYKPWSCKGCTSRYEHAYMCSFGP
ncbi:MAG: hypothetical protein LQ346_007169 [Caloplaca aetnensis]|nr:MAG: hypothetical protein LQ346_007169 [Caloplaca aetnensis]